MGVLDRFLSSKQDDKQEIWDLFDAGKNLMESHFYDRASVAVSYTHLTLPTTPYV